MCSKLKIRFIPFCIARSFLALLCKYLAKHHQAQDRLPNRHVCKSRVLRKFFQRNEQKLLDKLNYILRINIEIFEIQCAISSI